MQKSLRPIALEIMILWISKNGFRGLGPFSIAVKGRAAPVDTFLAYKALINSTAFCCMVPSCRVLFPRGEKNENR